MLTDYVKLSATTHTPQTLSACFGMHTQFAKTGSMLGTNWDDFK